MALEDIMVHRNGWAHLRQEMPQEDSAAYKPVGTLFMNMASNARTLSEENVKLLRRQLRDR